MHTSDNLSSVLNKVDLLVAEIGQLRSAGPHFRIVHRFRMPGSDCLPGEEVFAVFSVFRGRERQLKLAVSQHILFDYLARHSRVFQNAKQIELGIRADDFYHKHGRNARSGIALVRRIPRSAVREHIKRIHRALAVAFQEASLPLDPRKVLLVEQTISNEVQYRLKATCSWTHLDLISRDSQPVWI